MPPEIAPFAPAHPGCGAAVPVVYGQFSHCQAEPSWVGLATFRRPRRTRWVAFACDEHRDWLPDARPLDAEARAELAWRREQWARAVAGLVYEPVLPLPDA